MKESKKTNKVSGSKSSKVMKVGKKTNKMSGSKSSKVMKESKKTNKINNNNRINTINSINTNIGSSKNKMQINNNNNNKITNMMKTNNIVKVSDGMKTNSKTINTQNIIKVTDGMTKTNNIIKTSVQSMNHIDDSSNNQPDLIHGISSEVNQIQFALNNNVLSNKEGIKSEVNNFVSTPHSTLVSNHLSNNDYSLLNHNPSKKNIEIDTLGDSFNKKETKVTVDNKMQLPTKKELLNMNNEDVLNSINMKVDSSNKMTKTESVDESSAMIQAYPSEPSSSINNIYDSTHLDYDEEFGESSSNMVRPQNNDKNNEINHQNEMIDDTSKISNHMDENFNQINNSEAFKNYLADFQNNAKNSEISHLMTNSNPDQKMLEGPLSKEYTSEMNHVDSKVKMFEPVNNKRNTLIEKISQNRKKNMDSLENNASSEIDISPTSNLKTENENFDHINEDSVTQTKKNLRPSDNLNDNSTSHLNDVNSHSIENDHITSNENLNHDHLTSNENLNHLDHTNTASSEHHNPNSFSFKSISDENRSFKNKKMQMRMDLK